MNALLNSQVSGNQWPQTDRVVLHQESRLTRQRASLQSEPLHELASFVLLEEQMADFTAEHIDAVNEVRRYFVLPPDSSVSTFLSEHRSLPPLLLESVPQLRECFGCETVFILRAPIDESGSQTLNAVALWPASACDARKALAKFDETWWIAHSRLASGHLAFTYELV